MNSKSLALLCKSIMTQIKVLLQMQPTVQRGFHRLLLALYDMDRTIRLLTCDKSQPLDQVETPERIQVFVCPPPMLNIPSHMLHIVNCPLYVILEEGLHWDGTYRNGHRKKLLCLLPFMNWTMISLHKTEWQKLSPTVLFVEDLHAYRSIIRWYGQCRKCIIYYLWIK